MSDRRHIIMDAMSSYLTVDVLDTESMKKHFGKILVNLVRMCI